MATDVPVSIKLWVERTTSVARSANILRDRLEHPRRLSGSTPAPEDLHDMAWEYLRYPGRSPLVIAELALEWAYEVPPPSVASLRAVRASLEAALADRSLAFTNLRNVGQAHKATLPPWLDEVVREAAVEQRQVSRMLRESWPVGDEKEERRRLAEMRAGKVVGLDEAFTQITGVPPEKLRRDADSKTPSPGR
jgi:hypothetical protein